MDPRAAAELVKQLKSKADIVLIPRAGHHVYIDNVRSFNRAVLRATLDVEFPSEEGDMTVEE